MKTINTTILSILFLAVAFKNTNAQSVNYKVLADDPYNHNLEITALPFYTDYAPKNNLSLGYGLNASLIYKKLATFNMYIERPYGSLFDWGYHFGTVGIFSSPTVNKLHKFLDLEIGTTYHLRDRTKTKNRKVVLSSVTSGRYTTTTSISVPATVRKILGVRGGMYNYHTVITARQNGDIAGDLAGGGDMKGVISTDGSRFGGAARLYSTPEDPFFNTESATNMKVLGIYAGLSSTSYHYIKIDADGYGEKGGSRFLNFYADVMIAPVRIDDFVGADGKRYDVSGKGAQGFKTRPYGARVGYEYSIVPKRIGYYAKTEIGIKPGLASSKFYVSLGFGITVNAKIKKFASETE
jgi:hypothetical protein